jgi:hypothetical protein
MTKFDLVHLIGNKTCMVASQITQLVASEPACTRAETWNMGAIVIVAAVVILAGMVIHARRKLYRQTYLW